MAATSASTAGYTLVKTINLPGTVGGHGDWVAYDAATKAVWIAQSPDNNVVVVDTKTNTVSGVVPGILNSNVVALTPNYAFVTDPGNNVTVVLDKTTLQRLGTVAQTGTTPDGAVYVPSTNQVFVTSDDNNSDAVLSATPGFQQSSTFGLLPDPSQDGPDVATYVAAKDRLYQPNSGTLDVIDPKTKSIVASYNLLSTGDLKPPVYDPTTNRLLVGTTTNQLLVVNPDNGQVLSTIPISGSVDEMAVDVSARLAFVGDKAGVVDVVNLDSMTLVGDLPAEKAMHTLTVDPTTHEVYVYENTSNKLDIFAPSSSVMTSSTSAASVKNGVADLTSTAGMQATVQTSSGGTTVRVDSSVLNAGASNQIAFIDGTLDVGASSPAAQIIRLYTAALGRTPTAADIAQWNGAIGSGFSATDVAQGLISSAEGQGVYKAVRTDTDFITQTYKNAFGRAPDADGLKAIQQALASGVSRAQIIVGVANSTEETAATASKIKTGVWIADDKATVVQKLYYAALDRSADAGGLRQFTTAMSNGFSSLNVAKSLVGSKEFSSIYGGLTTSEFVTALYRNVLGRASDSAGFASYTAGLNSGATTRADVVLGFSQSAERAAMKIETQGTSLTSTVVPVA